LYSCTGPKYLAKEFVKNDELPVILFIASPEIYTEFFRPVGFSDSLDFYKPEKIMHLLDDTLVSLLSEIYTNAISERIHARGFTLFEQDSIAHFFDNNYEKWQLQLVQLTFEEHRIVFEDELTFTDNSVQFDTVISEYQMNVWYELIPINADSTIPNHLLFASVSAQEIISGRFVYNQIVGEYIYKYEFFEANINDIFSMVAGASVSHANYLYDFFLNRYLYFNGNTHNNKIKQYYRYDIFRNKIIPALSNRFVFL